MKSYIMFAALMLISPAISKGLAYHPHFTFEEYVQEMEPQTEPEVKVEVAKECEITERQREVINFSFEYGLKQDLQYSLAAIAIKESAAGLWNVNIKGQAGGYYHVTVDKVIRHFGWEDNPFNRNRALQHLLDDKELAAQLAVAELNYWKGRRGEDWNSVWASYNVGYIGKKSSTGREYASDIAKIIKQIKQCEWDKLPNDNYTAKI